MNSIEILISPMRLLLVGAYRSSVHKGVNKYYEFYRRRNTVAWTKSCERLMEQELQTLHYFDLNDKMATIHDSFFEKIDWRESLKIIFLSPALKLFRYSILNTCWRFSWTAADGLEDRSTICWEICDLIMGLCRASHPLCTSQSK